MVCLEANDVLPILRKQFESVTAVLHFVWTVSGVFKGHRSDGRTKRTGDSEAAGKC